MEAIYFSDIKSKLSDDEILLDYYFYDEDLKVVIISKDQTEILSSFEWIEAEMSVR